MKNTITFLILVLLAFQVSAQTSTEKEEKNENLVLIIKNSGGEYIGEIVSDDGREILLITKTIGKIYINKSEISSISKVDENVKSARLQEVQHLLRLQQMQFNKKFINSTLNVLVLKNGKKNNQYLGRTPFNQSIYFTSKNNNLIGSTIDITVKDAFQNSLTGIIKSN